MNNTKPFPFHRYRQVLETGPGPFLAWSAKYINDPVMDKVTRQMYPAMDARQRMNAIIGGGMEHVQAYMVATEGTVLHVADMGLIEACRNSEVPENLTLRDFMLPYPFIEVRFHKDSRLQPALLVNTKHPTYRQWSTDYKIMLSASMGQIVEFATDVEMEEGWVLATAEDKDGARDFVRALMVDASKPLWAQMLHSPRSVATDEELEETRQAVKVLLLSLLMRRENLKVQPKKTVTGLPAKVAKNIEKRPQYAVTPPKLISPQQARDRHGAGDTGREVKGHWRQAHIRVLSHERYKRNQDGSPKVLFIAPVAVKGGGRCERRV